MTLSTGHANRLHIILSTKQTTALTSPAVSVKCVSPSEIDGRQCAGISGRRRREGGLRPEMTGRSRWRGHRSEEEGQEEKKERKIKREKGCRYLE